MKIVWTEEQITKAKELRKKNLSFTEVGKELGMTKNAVIGKFHRQKKKEGHKVKKRTRGPSHNYYFKTIGSGICNVSSSNFFIP